MEIMVSRTDPAGILRYAFAPKFQGSRSSDLFAIISPIFSLCRQCSHSKQVVKEFTVSAISQMSLGIERAEESSGKQW